MPIHNWRRVGAGTFHHFHNAWITHLCEALNAGRLPKDVYALGEQQTSEFGPDVVALHLGFQDLSGSPHYEPPGDSDADLDGGMVAVAEAPPKVQLAVEANEETEYYFVKRRSVVAICLRNQLPKRLFITAKRPCAWSSRREGWHST